MKNFVPKNKSFFKQPLLWVAMVLPMGQSDVWKRVDYANIPAHQVTRESTTMRIQIENSASPIVHTFHKPVWVTGVDVDASVKGSLIQIPKGIKQGQKSADDAVLRLGLIVRGDKKLNWLQRKIAPRWLLKLEKLMPQNYGINHVQFISTCLQKDLLHKKRTHYLDSSLKEECVTLLEKVGPFTLSKKWTQPLQVLGVWIATDGDDTQSRFELKINSIEISHK